MPIATGRAEPGRMRTVRWLNVSAPGDPATTYRCGSNCLLVPRDHRFGGWDRRDQGAEPEVVVCAPHRVGRLAEQCGEGKGRLFVVSGPEAAVLCLTAQVTAVEVQRARDGGVRVFDAVNDIAGQAQDFSPARSDAANNTQLGPTFVALVDRIDLLTYELGDASEDVVVVDPALGVTRLPPLRQFGLGAKPILNVVPIGASAGLVKGRRRARLSAPGTVRWAHAAPSPRLSSCANGRARSSWSWPGWRSWPSCSLSFAARSSSSRLAWSPKRRRCSCSWLPWFVSLLSWSAICSPAISFRHGAQQNSGQKVRPRRNVTRTVGKQARLGKQPAKSDKTVGSSGRRDERRDAAPLFRTAGPG